MDLAHDLTSTPEYAKAAPIIAELNELVKAMSKLYSQLEYNKEQLRKEIEKAKE